MPFSNNCIHCEACRNTARLVGSEWNTPVMQCNPHMCRAFEDVRTFARRNSLFTRAQVRSEIQKAPWKYL